MPNTFTENTFASTYKDDYRDSDNYYRLLFNSGRALQARELTQLQTIIQEEIGRFGRNIFKDGSAVNPGGPTIRNNIEFVKLNTTTGATPTSSLVGTEFTQTGGTGIAARIIRVLAAEGSDPATIYVQYTNTSNGSPGATPVRFTPGATITDGSTNLVVQTANTAENPAVGQGTEISNAGGDFFVRGHFVYALPQTIVLDKYGTTPTKVVGFKVTEDIVTVSDNDALYDNQGATPNRSSPGADRYRIRLTLIDRDDIAADENFVYYCNVVDGEIVDDARGENNYDAIRDVLALRTAEESGNYTVKDFRVDFRKDSSVSTNIIASVSPGIAYVNGYRATQGNVPVQIRIAKPRTTIEIQNETVGVSYGNYINADVIEGNIVGSTTNRYTAQNLSTSTTDPSGSVIGTARVRYVEEDGANYKVYLFDITMNSGQSFRDVRTIGTGADDFARVLLEGGVAKLRDPTNRSLLFPLPRIRPSTIDDVDFEVQRVIEGTVASGTSFSLSLSGNERFANTSQWFVTSLDSGGIVPGAGFTLTGGGTGVNITNLPGTGSYAVYSKVNKTIATPKTKTLTETTFSGSIESDGSGLRFLNLHKPDIYKVLSIKETDSDGRSIRSNFSIDNGQRDGFYDNGRLILSTGASAPATVFTRFQYLAHGTGGDYFDVTSYTGQIAYEKIPYYRTTRGEKVNLRNIIDFRPTVDSDGNFAGAGATRIEVPTNGDVWQGDVTYYQPRSDRLVLNTDGIVVHVQGEPSFSAALPPVPENTMPLFNINFPAYVLSDSDVSITALKYKRYQMSDIGKIETRLDTLEEAVALSLLEAQTANLLVLDSAGNLRTKSGFFVDNFSDLSFANVAAGDYRAAIDPSFEVLTPQQSTYGIDLVYDSAQSSNTILKGDMIFVKYTHTPIIQQNLISGTENVNPFAVISGTGNMTLSPASDTWHETVYMADNIIDGGTIQEDAPGLDLNEGELAVGTAAARAGTWINPAPVQNISIPLFGFNGVLNFAGLNLPLFNFAGIGGQTTWNWTGTNNTGGVTFTGEGPGSGTWGTAPDGLRRRRRERQFSQRFVANVFTKAELIGDRLVSTALLPWMRARKVMFRVQGLRPNTRYFPYFDNVKVDTYCREEADFERAAAAATTTVEYGDKYKLSATHPDGATNLISDANGEIVGSFFIPASPSLKFKTGTREFKLLDISVNQNDAATSRATSNFVSQGVLDTRQKDIKHTRVEQIATRRWTEVTWEDPLAQTFRTPEGVGIYVTKVDAFLRSTETVVPIQMQIRPVEDGAPSSDRILPGASTFVNATDVSDNLSSTTQADVLANPTTFEFDEPVYLNPNTEYAIVLLADTTNYSAYVGETYAFELGSTEKRISRQPSMGSLFKSQNGTTWEPDQTKDLAFTIYKAQFDTAGGYAIFENRNTQPVLATQDPFFMDSGDATVTMLNLDHGFQVNDYVQIAGLDSATSYNGILGTSILGSRQITKIDGFGFQFEADSSSTSAGRFGGSNVTTSKQFVYDLYTPLMDALVPESTSVSVEGRFMTGKSFAGTETAYAQTPSVSGWTKDIYIGEENSLSYPQVIAHPTREATAGKSITFKATLNTTNADVSPYIDGQRTSVLATSYRIDNQDEVLTSGYNVPISWVSETDPAFGSAMAKHITTIQRLTDDAVGLKVLFNAVRPAEADIKVYYRTATGDENIEDKVWTYQAFETTTAPDAVNFREYRALIGGTEGTLTPFSEYQLKLVFTTTNSSRIPAVRALRVIAMAT